MLCLSGFELYSRWVPLRRVRYDSVLPARDREHKLKTGEDRGYCPKGLLIQVKPWTKHH